MTLAAAAEVGVPEKPYTVAEARLKVGNLVKHSRDPLVVFKGTEVLARLEQIEKETRVPEQETDIREQMALLHGISPTLAQAYADHIGLPWRPPSNVIPLRPVTSEQPQ